VLWDIVSGRIHRSLRWESGISAAAFDESCGVWIATGAKAFLVGINGGEVGGVELDSKIVKIAVIPLHSSELSRAALFGTETGALVLVSLDLIRGESAVKQLQSEHRAQITCIVVRSSLKSFVSSDAAGVSCLWTAAGLGGEPINVAMFEMCAYCWGKPVVSCPMCDRAVCRECIGDSPDAVCSLCAALSI
jgi:hypothetical protein